MRRVGVGARRGVAGGHDVQGAAGVHAADRDGRERGRDGDVEGDRRGGGQVFDPAGAVRHAEGGQSLPAHDGQPAGGGRAGDAGRRDRQRQVGLSGQHAGGDHARGGQVGDPAGHLRVRVLGAVDAARAGVASASLSFSLVAVTSTEGPLIWPIEVAIVLSSASVTDSAPPPVIVEPLLPVACDVLEESEVALIAAVVVAVIVPASSPPSVVLVAMVSATAGAETEVVTPPPVASVVVVAPLAALIVTLDALSVVAEDSAVVRLVRDCDRDRDAGAAGGQRVGVGGRRGARADADGVAPSRSGWRPWPRRPAW